MPDASRAGFVAVSTSPAIDRVARIKGPATGIAPASELLETAGGKAIHAACVAARLGAPVTVITTAGGWSGRLLLDLLEAEPVGIVPVRVGGATRGTYTLVAAEGGALVEVHEPAAHLTAAEADGLVVALAGTPSEPRVVAVCGSLPPSAPTDIHARLVETARAIGAFTILDSSSPAAAAAGLEAGPDLFAPNLAEAETLLDADPGDARAEAIAGALRERGAAAVWLSLGAEGSLFASADATVRLTAPAPAHVVNAVGCGDALVGGFAAGLLKGLEPLEAAKLGAAAATEKLAHLHPGRVDRAGVEALVPLVEAAAIREAVR
jgi:1-phosphofructokinase family hexose kinase